MSKESRTDIQIYSAIAMLVAGVGLTTADDCQADFW